MKDMKDISASAQEALEHARDKAFGKVKPGILEPLKSVPVSPIMAWYFEKQKFGQEQLGQFYQKIESQTESQPEVPDQPSASIKNH